MKLNRLLPKQFDNELPLIPIKELVVFPHNVVNFFIGRQDSILALDEALSNDKDILLAFQTESSENPSLKDFHGIATIAHVLQALKLPDGKLRILVEGRKRVCLNNIQYKKDIPWGQHSPIKKIEIQDFSPVMQIIKDQFLIYTKNNNNKIPKEIITKVLTSNDTEKVVGLICMILNLPPERMTPFLMETNEMNRMEELAILLQLENENLRLKENISVKAKKRLDRTQKEYFLNEQLKEIHKELGDEKEDPSGLKELEEKLEALELTDEARKKTRTEFKRLSRLQPMSPESGVLRTYLEWIADLPWSVRTTDSHDMASATQILDADHYGLKEPKERILDFIAVKQMESGGKSPILCFVGPPGTGKTSLGRSVARTLGRNFIRISLGGVRDEAEIRGHRKTYVGALPGKIIQGMKKAGSVNPVVLLDEVDKMSNDYRGDPSSALLEVLDPEQNNNFSDHYLELPYNLSEVMFITTANNLEAIPHPLRDRMEIIRTLGYTVLEKKNIARQFIIPKQRKENGLGNADIYFPERSLELLIRGYTQEAGVRNLERAIAKVMRKIARNILHEQQSRSGQWVMNSASIHLNQSLQKIKRQPKSNPPATDKMYYEVTPEMVKKYLGKERLEDDLGTEDRPGLAPGLYYDGGGGGVLPIEAVIFSGDGKLLLTGQLGDVMKESAQLALSFLKTNRQKFGLRENFDRKKDIHIHVPQGAIPVDGPSAGIALTAALLSAVLQIPLKSGIAMTGEITLTDRILPVGGIKEKTLAARRRSFLTIVMPKDNKRDVDELPNEINEQMTFLYHNNLSDALTELFPKGTFT